MQNRGVMIFSRARVREERCSQNPWPGKERRSLIQGKIFAYAGLEGRKPNKQEGIAMRHCRRWGEEDTVELRNIGGWGIRERVFAK